MQTQSKTIKIVGIIVILVAVGIAIAQHAKISSYSSKVMTLSAPVTATVSSSKTTVPKVIHVNVPIQSSAVSKPSPVTSQQAKAYASSEITKHNNQNDCWSAINGNIYDLTSWISQHPGGEGAILSICGTGGSAAFNDQHGGQSRPNNILTSFKIGVLKP